MGLRLTDFIVTVLAIALLVACSSEIDPTIETKQKPVGKRAQQPVQEETSKSIAEPLANEQTTTLEKEPGVIYVATPQDVADKMLQLAKVSKKDVVFDLG